jgi:signal transduction histidine kinase/CheY-like chemotaxis protein
MSALEQARRRENLADVQGQSLQMVSLFLLPLGILWLWGLICPSCSRTAPTVAWVGCAILVATSIAGYRARPREQRIASAALIFGILAATWCALLTFRIPDLIYLVILAVAVASLLFDERAILPVALGGIVPAICIVCGYLGLSLWGRAVLLPIGVIGLTSAASWIATHNLYDALDSAWQGYHQALQNQREARERRAELRRALHALDEATSRLQRVNQELILARREAEEARALKEQFVANVSHELRTPLNIIAGFAEIMCKAPETYEGVRWTADLQSDIQEMYRASQHLQSLINDVLDLSRIDAARLPMFREFADLRSIIREAIETISPLLRQRNLTCDADLPETLPQLLIDRTRIRQVMLNLLNNAVRFTDSGGITVRCHLDDEVVVVSVQDTGVGIPPERLGTIFEKFSTVDGTSRRGGVGLGLTLSREFVALHGGDMWVESTVGVGSTFYFSLPLPGTRPLAAPLERVPHRASLDRSTLPVVVVDPDPTVAEMLGRYLGDRRTLWASDTREAEQLIERTQPLAVIVNQAPDAPVGSWLGDLGATSARYAVPVLRCSIPSPSWLKESVGVDECLTKPVSRDTLTRILRRHCPEDGRVLIVDDDPGFVSLVERIASAMPGVAEVLTARSGHEALSVLAGRAPDLVLLDLLMPEMGGLEVLDRLRADPALAHTRFVLVTATSYTEDVLADGRAYLTLSQSRGISAGRLTELLDAILGIVRPDYAEEESTAATV